MLQVARQVDQLLRQHAGLFRQDAPGDWDGVFKRVAKALITLAGKRASGAARR